MCIKGRCHTDSQQSQSWQPKFHQAICVDLKFLGFEPAYQDFGMSGLWSVGISASQRFGLLNIPIEMKAASVLTQAHR